MKVTVNEIWNEILNSERNLTDEEAEDMLKITILLRKDFDKIEELNKIIIN